MQLKKKELQINMLNIESERKSERNKKKRANENINERILCVEKSAFKDKQWFTMCIIIICNAILSAACVVFVYAA